MSRWRKAVKIAALTGVVAVGGGAFVLTKKMFVDRHAIVSLTLYLAYRTRTNKRRGSIQKLLFQSYTIWHVLP